MSQTPEFAPAYVSVVNEFPEDLYDAMRNFVRSHPHWDQYRLMQVAVAGFLFQQGSRERAVARHYLDGLFDRAGCAVSHAEPLLERTEGQGEAAVMPLRQRPGVPPAKPAAAVRPVASPLPHHQAAPPASRRAA